MDAPDIVKHCQAGRKSASKVPSDDCAKTVFGVVFLALDRQREDRYAENRDYNWRI